MVVSVDVIHKVLIYKEHHSVCPFVGIGTLPPLLSPASVPLPPVQRGGGHARLRVGGWGSPNSDDWRKSLALCLLCDVIRNYRQVCTVVCVHLFSTVCAV
jgi:hypothetical protein